MLLGQASGTLATATTYSSGGSNPMSVAIGDVNGDGRADLVVANSGSGNVGVLLGQVSGMLAAAATYGAGGGSSVAIGDLNGDGRADLTVNNSSSGMVAVLPNSQAVAMFSAHGILFDVQAGGPMAGQLVNGSDNALRRAEPAPGRCGRLRAHAPASESTRRYENAGRSGADHRGPDASTARSPCPNTGNEDFARTVDVFENPTASPITTTVRIVGNLGSDAATTVWTTSDGDTIIETTDQWIGTDDADGTGTPAIIHYIHGPAGLQPTSVSRVDRRQHRVDLRPHGAGRRRRCGWRTSRSWPTRAPRPKRRPDAGGHCCLWRPGRGVPEPEELASLANFDFLNPLVVTTSADLVDLHDGLTSLREAITYANSHSGHDTITFDIGGGGLQTIRPLWSLPEITDPVTIDGTTQPGYAGHPIIEIDGSQAGTGAHGLWITAGDSTVRGLVINSFVRGRNPRCHERQQCHRGKLHRYGSDRRLLDKGNVWCGVVIGTGAKINRIEGNVISGNDGYGVVIDGLGTDNNVIVGNYIGTDFDGDTPLGNGPPGVWSSRGPGQSWRPMHNRIGGDATERNVISGNGGMGVLIVDASNNEVAGNYIGTKAAGDEAMGNGLIGIFVVDSKNNADHAQNNTIERNLVSGNSSTGVQLSSDSNIVAGNYIGTDVTGTEAIPNLAHGMLISGSLNRVGTNGDSVADQSERNVISGNNGDGVAIVGPGAVSNIIAGNYIGTDVNGSKAIPNGTSWGRGISIEQGAKLNVIGTDGNGIGDVAEGNVISGNVRSIGVWISDVGTDGNVVAGNFIGTDADGDSIQGLGNGFHGVAIGNGAADNRIGTKGSATERNVIAGSYYSGIVISGVGSDRNVVAGNYIGTDVTGALLLGNGQSGVWPAAGIAILGGAKSNRVGTDDDGVANQWERNLVSGNMGRGVLINGMGSDLNVVAGNYIGTDITGTLALANGALDWAGAGSRFRGAPVRTPSALKPIPVPASGT